MSDVQAQSGIIEQFTAAQKGDAVFLQWKIGKGNSCIDMSVQRHMGEGNYQTLHTVEGICGSPDSDSWYDWTDTATFWPGTSLTYRINASNGTVVSEERQLVWRSTTDRFSVMPNPASGSLRMLMGAGLEWPIDLHLFDRSGRKIAQQRITAPQKLSACSNGFESGFYLLHLRDAQGQSDTERVLILR